MFYHDMTNDYRNRDYKITIKLQEGCYTIKKEINAKRQFLNMNRSYT